MPELNNRLIDTKEAAARMGISPRTLNDWRADRRADQPAYIRIGAAIRYRPSAIEQWLESRTVQPGVPAEA